MGEPHAHMGESLESLSASSLILLLQVQVRQVSACEREGIARAYRVETIEDTISDARWRKFIIQGDGIRGQLTMKLCEKSG